MSGVVFLFKVSEDVLECKAFKVLHQANFEEDWLCACLILHLPNLHTTPKRQPFD